jgi:cytochrome c553
LRDKMMQKLSLVLAMAGLLSVAAPLAQAQNAEAGSKKIQMCIGCHGIPGYQASFPEVYKVPKISGQNAKYIEAALHAYAKGDRKHPTMRSIAGSMSEQDIADVAAYYAQDGQSEPADDAAPHEAPAAAAEVLAKGACASCHGANFSQPIDPSYPKLAGQYADYLYGALKSYQTEGHALLGRNNAIMGGIAKPLSHAELKAVAAYLGSLPGTLKTVPQSRFR